MVPAPSVKVPRVSTYSGSRLALHLFAYGAFTLSGWLSQNHSAKSHGSLPRSEPRNARIPVWALSISLAATLEIDVSFSSSGYLDVSVHRVPLHTLWIQAWIHGVFPCGFPHSDIRGSLDICSSPRLFAAYHVFLRLLVPRHPPCALLCLTFLFFHDCIALQPCSLFSFFASASFSLLSQLSASASHCLSLLSFDVSFSSLNIRFSRYMQYFI